MENVLVTHVTNVEVMVKHKAKKKTISVKIPKGVDDGTRIRLTGKGEAGSKAGVVATYAFCLNRES